MKPLRIKRLNSKDNLGSICLVKNRIGVISSKKLARPQLLKKSNATLKCLEKRWMSSYLFL